MTQPIQTTAVQAMPELPVALGLMCGTSYNPPKEREFFGIVTGEVPVNKCDVFTADQMHAYAQAYAAQCTQELEAKLAAAKSALSACKDSMQAIAMMSSKIVKALTPKEKQ